MQKRAVQFTKKPYLPLFSSETADKFAKDYAIKKSFRHALHLVTAHLHRQNQVAHALRTRDFWLASLSMHFPIHFGRRAHEYPITLSGTYEREHDLGEMDMDAIVYAAYSHITEEDCQNWIDNSGIYNMN